MSPQKAFYSEKVSVPVEASSGRVCAEFVMCYPPGIPIIAPGEVFTDAIVEKIMAYKAAGLLVQGPADPDADVILTCQTPGFVHKGC